MLTINPKYRKYHVIVIWEAGYDRIDTGTEMVWKRIPERDYLEVAYKKDNKIILRPHHKLIEISGDSVEAAVGLAFFMRENRQDHDNLSDEHKNLHKAFTFSVDNHIEKLNWTSTDVVRAFINNYNRIYNSVLLLG